tara:strand:- start:1319 stop:1699 length:381 start_codon:yes stop_codon:yes gene_type:complete
MNLLGLKNKDQKSNLTLDKINSRLKKELRNKNISLSIMQTHIESKAVSYLHKKRNNLDHIIISPGIWNINGYLIKETLEILKIPFSIVLSSKNQESIFEKIIPKKSIAIDNQYIDGYLQILYSLDS